ncbi:MAG: hypothetical protein ACE5KU_06975 [Nitrososphaerales archaeon]
MSIDRLGMLLIWIGVAAWAPYFALMAFGYAQPVLPFLTVHLSGVIPGALIKQRRRIAKLVRWLKS